MDRDELVGTTREVEVDWTVQSDYSKLVSEELEEYSNIEVQENLTEGGVHAQKAWAFWFQYLTREIWKTSLYDEIVRFCDGVGKPRILSLGCGYGGHEIQIARSLRSSYEMIGVDLNPGILARARAAAAAQNLNIRFLPLDMNFIEIRPDSFDLIMAHASLHHILNLEHVFHQMYRGLKDGGRLIVQDVIGKTQVLFWKPNVDFAIDVLNKMPARYRDGVSLPPYSEPSVQVGMEGIRQEEIEPLLSRFFGPIKMFKYGSFMRLICTHPELGKRFDPDREPDRLYLLSLFDLDVRQVAEGKLAATELIAVYEKRTRIDLNAIYAEARARIRLATKTDEVPVSETRRVAEELGRLNPSFHEWLSAQIADEGYWFHRIEIAPGLITPGWDDPAAGKLAHFGLPERMDGLRVLDIGCAEGFFSFEAERRGAEEIVAIDSWPGSIRRFNICRAALNSRATAFLTNVYDLDPKRFGTFDLVMCFGVLYHVRHPLLALERIFSVCKGTLLLQSTTYEDTEIDKPVARFYPAGKESGPAENRVCDQTVFWIASPSCVRAMLEHVGFKSVTQIADVGGPIFRARAPSIVKGEPPAAAEIPWDTAPVRRPRDASQRT